MLICPFFKVLTGNINHFLKNLGVKSNYFLDRTCDPLTLWLYINEQKLILNIRRYLEVF